MLLFDIGLAVSAGVLTVAAPCILPMLPIILGASIGHSGRTRPLFIVLGFVIAFTAAALAFGLFSHLIGLSADTLRGVAVGLLGIFGLLMVWPRPFEWLMTRLSPMIDRAGRAGARTGSDRASGFLLGMSLGVVWTPCAGPVLGAIFTLIATAEDVGRASVLLFAYALGAGLPMLVIAYGGQWATTKVRSLVPFTRRLQQGFGVVIILVAIAIHLEYDTVVTLWLTAFYPSGRLGL